MRRLIATSALALAVAGPAAAQDYCYDHNGSTMRFQNRGSELVISYEVPKSVLRNAGVRRGTVLVDGRFRAHEFAGTARRFSKYCPGSPLMYEVAGWVEGEGPMVLEGSYPVNKRCKPTGQHKRDRLVFTPIGPC